MAQSGTTLPKPVSDKLFEGFTLSQWFRQHDIHQIDVPGRLEFRRGEEKIACAEVRPYGFSYSQIAGYLDLPFSIPTSFARFRTTVQEMINEVAKALSIDPDEVTPSKLVRFKEESTRPPTIPEVKTFADLMAGESVNALYIDLDAQLAYVQTAYPKGLLAYDKGRRIYILNPNSAGEYYLAEAEQMARTLLRWLSEEKVPHTAATAASGTFSPERPTSHNLQKSSLPSNVFQTSRVVREAIRYASADMNSYPDKAYFDALPKVDVSAGVMRKVRAAIFSGRRPLATVITEVKDALDAGGSCGSEDMVLSCILKRKAQFTITKTVPHMVMPVRGEDQVNAYA